MQNTGKHSHPLAAIYRESINYRHSLVNTRKCQLRFPPIGNDRIMVPVRFGASSGGEEEEEEGEEEGEKEEDAPVETGTPT